jgi:hypothetical protein
MPQKCELFYYGLPAILKYAIPYSSLRDIVKDCMALYKMPGIKQSKISDSLLNFIKS